MGALRDLDRLLAVFALVPRLVFLSLVLRLAFLAVAFLALVPNRGVPRQLRRDARLALRPNESREEFLGHDIVHTSFNISAISRGREKAPSKSDSSFPSNERPISA